MNDYKELIELLAHPTDGRDSADIMIAAADAIEQIVAEYNELDKAHGELFIEYHKVKKQRDAAIAWLPKTCGYCKHYKPQKKSAHWENRANYCNRIVTIKVQPYDFCSYGERKDGDDE